MVTAAQERTFRIAITKDKICAHLLLQDVAPETVSRDGIIEKLTELKIPTPPELLHQVDMVVTDFKTGKLSGEPILLAKGREPVPATPARFELTKTDESLETEDNLSPTDFHRSQIITVAEGEEFGQYFPATDPVPGEDVHGKPIKTPQPPKPIEFGTNVELADDGKTVRSLVIGKVHINSSSVDVLEIIEVSGDVDFSTGNIDSPINVLISGTVRDDFDVKSGKTITVRKAIEAANIEASGDIQVNGGIAARSKGKIATGGEIFTKFCNEANILAQGNITIIREAMNSRLHTRGQLTIARGALIGGYAFAHKGAEINIIGSDADIETIIAIGIDPKDLAKVEKINQAAQKKRNAISKIRTAVKPMLAQLKRLTPQQREKATELIYQADEIEMQLDEEEKQKSQLLGWPEDVKEVGLTVNKRLHFGVKVIIGDKMTTFDKERQGHFKVCRRAVDRVEQIVIVDLVSGSITPQTTFEFVPEELPEAAMEADADADADTDTD